MTQHSTPMYLPKRYENILSTKTCTQMFIAALLVIAKNLEQPICLSTERLILIVLYLYNEIKRSNKKE